MDDRSNHNVFPVILVAQLTLLLFILLVKIFVDTIENKMLQAP